MTAESPMTEQEARMFWRGYAAGWEDACRPDPDRKTTYAAGYLAGCQMVTDKVKAAEQEQVPIDEKLQAYLAGREDKFREEDGR